MGKEGIIPVETIEQRILLIRGVKVMLDVDLAYIYTVPVKRLNEQVKRNKDRFPSDFMFQLTVKEFENLKSKIGTLNVNGTNRSQIATGSQRHRDPRFLPYAFTEHGVAMLSSVLSSPRAVQMNIFIIRAFIKLREVLATHKDLAQKVEDLERQQKENQKENIDQIAVIHSVLTQLIHKVVKATEPPKSPKSRRSIGFNKNI